MLDVAQFLEAIGDDNPSGNNLRLVAGDLTLSRINDLRLEIDSEIDVGGEAKAADWAGVRRECEDCLRERTKDLEVAGFLAESLTYLEGWDGLVAGFQLIRGLLAGFWDTLHPGFDDGEIILPIRARPLSWLGSSRPFLTAVKKIPITNTIGQNPLSWYDFEQSKRVDQAGVLADQTAHNELVEAGLISGEEWRSALNTTPTGHLAEVRSAIGACGLELGQLNSLCLEKFGDDAPYLQELGNLLEDCMGMLDAFANDPSQIGTESEAGTGAAEETSAGTGGGAGPGAGQRQVSGPIASREEAYRKLREAADYLRRTEPHSPVPALVGRAIAWGQMPFETLFKDVVKDSSTQDQVLEMLGFGNDEND